MPFNKAANSHQWSAEVACPPANGHNEFGAVLEVCLTRVKGQKLFEIAVLESA